jgi:hypothetical protein
MNSGACTLIDQAIRELAQGVVQPVMSALSFIRIIIVLTRVIAKSSSVFRVKPNACRSTQSKSDWDK